MAEDIFALAGLFTFSLRTGTASEQAKRWHHLLMAVGNFKRQGGSIHVERERLINAPAAALPPAPFVPPGSQPGTVPLAPTSDPGHAYFRTIKGLRRAPTASVVLAALWPDDNLIVDRRDLNAAIGLLLPRVCGNSTVDGLRAWTRDRRRFGITTSDYGWLRMVAVATRGQPGFGGVSMLNLERALIMLDKRTGQITGWPAYSITLARHAELCPHCQVLRRTYHLQDCRNSTSGPASRW